MTINKYYLFNSKSLDGTFNLGFGDTRANDRPSRRPVSLGRHSSDHCLPLPVLEPFRATVSRLVSTLAAWSRCDLDLGLV